MYNAATECKMQVAANAACAGTVFVVESPVTHYDLIIVGAGSGNMLVTAEMDDWRVAIVERDLFGGTCLNRGCIPSKMFIYAADVADSTRHLPKYGLRMEPSGAHPVADWPAIVARVFGRIDPIAEGGENYRKSLPNVDVYSGDGRFVGHKTMEVDGTRFTGERIVLAAGAHAFIPDVPGLVGPDAVPFHTSDTIMRIEALPKRLVIIGGGFIAVELGHVFEALGVHVTIVNRGPVLLGAEDHDISARFTEVVADRFNLVMGSRVDRARRTSTGIAIDVTTAAGPKTVEGDMLLVAAGRTPNGAQLGVTETGVALDDKGRIVVDETNQTAVPDIWALGDIVGRHQLKHMANLEAKLVAHNITNPGDIRSLDQRAAPHAVFASPQIGAVGPTERELRAAGVEYASVTHEYAGAAYGWAMEDTTSFVKLLGDPHTRTLLGAHIIGPQASLLVQMLVQGLHLGNTVDQLATGQIYIHPALSEVVEVALLKLCDAFDDHLRSNDGGTDQYHLAEFHIAMDEHV